VTKKTFGLTKQQTKDDGESYTINIVIICTPHLILVQ